MTADYAIHPAIVDGVQGGKKVPYGFATHVRVAGDALPAGADRLVDDDFTGSYVDFVDSLRYDVARRRNRDHRRDRRRTCFGHAAAPGAVDRPRTQRSGRGRLQPHPSDHAAGGRVAEPSAAGRVPNQTDTSGDSRDRIAAGFYSANNPATDLRESSVRTEGTDLVATLRVQDLEAASAALQYDPQHTNTAWMFLFYSPSVPGLNMGSGNPSSRWRYVAAINTLNLEDPASAGQASFEYGSFSLASGVGTQGTPESYNLIRLGAASGALDFVKDTVTLRVPLAAVRLQPGYRLTYQDAIAGGQLQYKSGTGAPNKPIFVADAMPYGQKFRSIAVGRNCPDGYA
ncbi:MAG: hypothetical protein ABR600_06325 [Actinomycetota bacterium]